MAQKGHLSVSSSIQPNVSLYNMTAMLLATQNKLILDCYTQIATLKQPNVCLHLKQIQCVLCEGSLLATAAGYPCTKLADGRRPYECTTRAYLAITARNSNAIWVSQWLAVSGQQQRLPSVPNKCWESQFVEGNNSSVCSSSRNADLLFAVVFMCQVIEGEVALC